MCGIFGIYGHAEASRITYLGLHALQHRGQESAGITANDDANQRMRTWRGMGLVVDVFDTETLNRLSGGSAIGHVRYSTAGDSDLANAQPLAVRHGRGHLAVAHNGNLVNANALRAELERCGSIFSSNADSEVVVHLYARQREERAIERVKSVLAQLAGAYSLLLLTDKKLIAARDPHGFRPLELGRLEADGQQAWVVASETSAFDLVGAKFVRHISPGEVIVIDSDGMRSEQWNHPLPQRRFCIFEDIYFARPDSLLGERSVYENRERLGARLAREQPARADIVIPVPDSGNTAALGYARESGIPFGMGLVRSHYIGRTFIEPTQSIRHFGVKLKLAPVRYLIDGRDVVVVDDSLVRGTTSGKIVAMLRAAGARSVHMRVSAPPTLHPCRYGIDMPSYEELIANDKTLAQIAAHIGADTLGYISVEGMLDALGATSEDTPFCHACFSGEYPVPFEEPQKARPLPLLQRHTRG